MTTGGGDALGSGDHTQGPSEKCPSGRWHREPASLTHTHTHTQELRPEFVKRREVPRRTEATCCHLGGEKPQGRPLAESQGIINCPQLGARGGSAHRLSYCFFWVFAFCSKLGLKSPRKTSRTGQERRVQHVVPRKGAVPGGRSHHLLPLGPVSGSGVRELWPGRAGREGWGPRAAGWVEPGVGRGEQPRRAQNTESPRAACT